MFKFIIHFEDGTTDTVTYATEQAACAGLALLETSFAAMCVRYVEMVTV